MDPSRPWEWPLNIRGQSFSGSGKTLLVYLLGNPILWWMIDACFILYIHLECYAKFNQRKNRNAGTDPRLTTCRWALLGWILNYFPYFLMTRVLYFHHYFPAHVFACMAAGKRLSETLQSVKFVQIFYLRYYRANTELLAGLRFGKFSSRSVETYCRICRNNISGTLWVLLILSHSLR